jgi:hypothetical protein
MCLSKKNINITYIIVCLYIDDILILDGNTNIMKTIKKMLINKFDIKDMSVTYVI